MKKKSIKLVAMIAAFCVAFTSLPMLAGGVDASAMAKKKKAKVATKITLYASAYGQNRASLSWNKIKKPEKGYAVFRDGRVIAHLGKKKLSFTDSGLSAGSTHYYQIKVYKTKKIKQWYNKKTGLWQKRRPPKKYRGKKRTITKYTYKKPSKAVYIKTAAAPKPKTAAVAPTTGGSESGTTGGGSSTTPTVPTSETRTVTDYLGVTRTIKKEQDRYGNAYWFCSAEGSVVDTSNNGLAKWDRTVNGEFTTSGGEVMLQKGGVTFNKSLLQNPNKLTDTDRAPYVEMYNGDFDKLTFDVQGGLTPVATYDKNKNPITEYYVMKDGWRLAKFERNYQETGKAGDDKVQKKGIAFRNKVWQLCDGCGFVSGNIIITVKYSGEKIATWTLPVNTDADERGLSPFRRNCLDFAMQAFGDEGPSGDYDADMHAVERQIRMVPYGYKLGTGNDAVYLTCTGGRNVLETFSVYQYGVYGFDSWGQYGTEETAKASGASDHSAFHLNNDPRKYYEANGSR